MYINFSAAPVGLSINMDAATRVHGVVEFVDSMIMKKTSTALTVGMRDVLNDGNAWRFMCLKHGTCVTLDAIGDLHDLLDANQRP
jgi:uncharacterized membrane protein